MIRLIVPAFITLLATIFANGICLADNAAIDISSAWVRQPPPGAAVAAGYLTIRNNSPERVVITGVSSPEFGAIEVHRTYIEKGMARMQAIGELEIPAGKQLELRPGSYHLMLFRPVKPPTRGDRLSLILHTRNLGCIETGAVVLRDAPAAR